MKVSSDPFVFAEGLFRLKGLSSVSHWFFERPKRAFRVTPFNWEFSPRKPSLVASSAGNTPFVPCLWCGDIFEGPERGVCALEDLSRGPGRDVCALNGALHCHLLPVVMLSSHETAVCALL